MPSSRPLVQCHPLLLACCYVCISGLTALKIVGDIDNTNDTRPPVHIGAVFPMSAGTGGWPGGEGCLPAASMALQDVNRVLKKFRLVMYWDDSECHPGLGARRLYELLYNNPTKLMLLSGCSLVSTVIAEAAPVWNLIVLAYGASSPALSDRTRFPTLFRTHPSATIHNPTRVQLFKKFNWQKIAILQSVEEVFRSTAADLEESCEMNNIKVLSVQSFFGDPAAAVRSLKRQDARIFVGLFYEKEARKVFCEVYKQKLYGRKYVWFLIGWYPDDWYIPLSGEMLNCTADQMKLATQYHFTTEALMHSQDNKPGVSGMNSKQFVHRLSEMLEKAPNITGGFPESPLAYDAIWHNIYLFIYRAAAIALNCTMNHLEMSNQSLNDFTYENAEIAQEILLCMKKTKFTGVSGDVMFSEKGERIALTQIEQLQDGKYEIMGFYDYRSENLTWLNKEKFVANKIPPDETIIQDKWLSVNFDLYLAFGLLGLLESRVIKESHPQVNNVMLVGFIIMFLSMLLFGLPVEEISISERYFPLFCYGQVVTIMYGFTLSYGAMFSKILMVHRLGNITMKNWVQTWKFYAIIGFLIGLDTIIVIIWISVDSLRRSVETFDSIEYVEENIKLRIFMEHCTSHNYELWIGLIYSYKGILLFFGLFLAYESRKIKTKLLNDSRLISMAIYNVAILCFITAPVEIIISSKPDASFAFFAVTVVLSTFLSMGLIFIPKIQYICQVPAYAEEQEVKTSQDTYKERLNALQNENVALRSEIIEAEKKLAEIKQNLNVNLLGDVHFNQQQSSGYDWRFSRGSQIREWLAETGTMLLRIGGGRYLFDRIAQMEALEGDNIGRFFKARNSSSMFLPQEIESDTML
ncbi:Gamma-aminobutyric acid type B receptor subunit 1 [Trichinella pseudospiralis]|uniref:Gamma-aminobutyric acid type B receptor subunit 1 n=1 Tax=Trichinella pseudospiralis TaxID=6337 RepID=A0A0V1JDF3_TRIPS|nr:Gamma-aminobutyric acid type B receptor subunit 1 [Trichinella pseudospiralis]